MTSQPLVPNLLVPGVTKAGTTSLYAYLSGHPQIHGGAGKELNLLGRVRFGEEVSAEAALHGWAAHFEGAGDARWRLDVSPQYFHGGPELVQRLASTLAPDARVLVILRDPVTRAWSAYRMKRARGRLGEDYDFDRFVEEAVEAERDGRHMTEEGNVLATIASGRYDQHLPTWLDAFAGRVRVVFFEDMATDRVAFLSEVLAWLDVEQDPIAEMDLSVRNLTMRHRNPRLAGLARRAFRRVEPVLADHPVLLGRLQRAYERLNTQPIAERFDARRQERVVALYRDSLEATAGLLADHPEAVGPLPRWLRDPSFDRSASGAAS